MFEETSFTMTTLVELLKETLRVYPQYLLTTPRGLTKIKTRVGGEVGTLADPSHIMGLRIEEVDYLADDEWGVAGEHAVKKLRHIRGTYGRRAARAFWEALAKGTVPEV